MFELNPTWLEPYYAGLVDDFLVLDNHPSIDRNISKIFTCVLPLGKVWEGVLLDKAFKVLLSATSLPAVKCNSMSLILHFGQDYPEILLELETIINSRIDFEKPSFVSRGKHILQLLKKSRL